MCGRFTLRRPAKVNIEGLPPSDLFDSAPRYNIAPSQEVFAVTETDEQRKVSLFRWGLIPSWSKDATAFINARAETLEGRGSFRESFERRRCLIPADGFYEWKRDGEHKRPHVARPKGLVAFAGLWEPWMGPNGEELDTACIVTTAANRTLSSLHDRMPAVIPPEAFDLWLDCANVDAETAAALLVPAPDDLFEAYEISTAVNRTANDSADLMEPLAPGAAAAMDARPAATAKPKKDDGQASLF